LKIGDIKKYSHLGDRGSFGRLKRDARLVRDRRSGGPDKLCRASSSARARAGNSRAADRPIAPQMTGPFLRHGTGKKVSRSLGGGGQVMGRREGAACSTGGGSVSPWGHDQAGAEAERARPANCWPTGRRTGHRQKPIRRSARHREKKSPTGIRHPDMAVAGPALRIDCGGGAQIGDIGVRRTQRAPFHSHQSRNCGCQCSSGTLQTRGSPPRLTLFGNVLPGGRSPFP